MSGIWNIVYGGDSEGPRRLNVKLIETELTAVALGIHSRVAAKSNLETELGRVLDTAEANDLSAIADNFETGTVQDRLVYAAKVRFILNLAELGLTDEPTFRSILGIP